MSPKAWNSARFNEYRGLGSNGTENAVKAFSFVDSAECPGVKRAGDHPQR